MNTETETQQIECDLCDDFTFLSISSSLDEDIENAIEELGDLINSMDQHKN